MNVIHILCDTLRRDHCGTPMPARRGTPVPTYACRYGGPARRAADAKPRTHLLTP